MLATIKKLLFATMLIVVSLVIASLAVEFGFRWLYPEDGAATKPILQIQRYLRAGDPAKTFLPHAFVSHVQRPHWIPAVNSRGFVNREFQREKPPGTKRIACLGASTTMTYPRLLETMLLESCRDPIEVLNFGVPAWTTAESLVNLTLHGQDYAPDIVIVHHAVNDLLPRVAPGYRSDYSHWRVPFRFHTSEFTRAVGPYSRFYCYLLWKRGMRQFDVSLCMSRPITNYMTTPDGGLLPETAFGYVRNIETIVRLSRAIGAKPLLVTMPHWTVGSRLHESAVDDHNAQRRRIATEMQVGLVDLAKSLDGRNEIFRDVVHFKGEFHRLRAEPIAAFLLESGWLAKK
jgi:hypothetical protein